VLHLRTTRLQLVAATPELAHAELADFRRLEKLLGAHVPPSWPPPLNDEATLRWTAAYLDAHPDSVGWVKWYFVHREHGEPRVVGCGGFCGLPQPDGTCEIGYSVLPESHRLGFAPEAVEVLVTWAFTHPEVKRVVAQTLPALVPSIRVLEKCGFVRAGAGREPGAILFERKRLVPAERRARGR
jgi:ribosomal-protein-alanine N-acetyltransferase